MKPKYLCEVHMCKRRARYDCPGNLCGTHWKQWFTCYWYKIDPKIPRWIKKLDAAFDRITPDE